MTGGGLRFSLQWQLTKKEDPDLSYCINSRRWRVRVLSFSSVAAAPNDHEVVSSSVQWVNVTGENTNHSFAGTFSTSRYYSFQVAHRGEFTYTDRNEFDLKPITFASQIYYFRDQRMLINDQDV